ncbi:uncharacterized protein LOC135847363 [Planococcus citri]|uniref:uncharacterized protein LOC135847363 n=1 Tax=Planococcus citri TaxID=170843 RepID=UPI0031F9BB2D
MNSSTWINSAFVLFLFAVLHEASAAEPTKYAQTVFRARQAEAKRNRIKYKPDTGGIDIYPGFILDKNMIDFLPPTLSNDEKLTQKFTRNDNDFFKVCRKSDQTPAVAKSLQWGVIDSLAVRDARPFFYSPIPRNKEHLDTKTFEFMQSPLSRSEKEYYRNFHAYNFCHYSPMPGLKHVTEKSTFGKSYNVSYEYGAGGKHSCDYFEFGLENMKPEKQGKENFNEMFEKGNKWTVLYSLCYDKKNYVTAFTKHEIDSFHLLHRKLNPYADAQKHEKNFVPDDMDKFYDLDNQLKSLKTNKLDKEIAAFDEEMNYFVRVRLVPEYDTLYESWQYIVHNYLNYAPQWRSVNLGQWLKVEQDIRNMAFKLEKKLTVYTGVYYRKNPPTLSIDYIDDKNKPVNKSLPIPSLFYKYVHTAVAGIVILTANGVSGSINDIKCTNVCSNYGWTLTSSTYGHRNQEETGLTKCCTPADFFKQRNVKDFLPKLDDDVQKILTYGGLEVDVGSRPITQIQLDEGMSDSNIIGATQVLSKPIDITMRAAWKNSFLIGGPMPVY